MGRELLSAEPLKTHIRSSPSSDSLCFCDEPDFKAKASIVSGQKTVLYVCKVFPQPFPLNIQPFFQALVLSTRHQNIKDANLSGRKLTAIRSILMREYQQVCGDLESFLKTQYFPWKGSRKYIN